MSINRDAATECWYVTPSGEQDCPLEPVVVMDYSTGLGACKSHVLPVLMFAMDKNGRGDAPRRPVMVVPAWRWNEYLASFRLRAPGTEGEPT